MQQTAEQFGMKIASFEKQVGYPVTYEGNRDRTNQNNRTDEATRIAARIARLPVRASLKQMQSRDTNLHSVADRSKHEIEGDCAGSAGQRTQD